MIWIPLGLIISELRILVEPPCPPNDIVRQTGEGLSRKHFRHDR